MRWKLAVPVSLLIVVWFLGGCRPAAGPVAPTPFPTTGGVTSTLPADPTSLTISEVNNALGLYQDAAIVVTGRLQRLPLLVCDGERFPSPATWSLTDEGAVLLASEYDQQVRQLLPEDLTMTVEGRLRRWEGPVGCGKQAQTKEVWYLETSRILAPRPLTQATLTPAGVVEAGATEVAAADSTETVAEQTPTAEPPPVEQPTASPPPESAPTAPPQTPVESPTATLDAGEDAESTPSPAVTIDTTATPTGTVSGTTTTTPGPGTPTATSALVNATSTAGQIIDKGDFYEVEGWFPAATLGAGEIHSWTLEIFEEEAFEIQAIAPVPADIILSLWRDGQQVIGPLNQAPAGATETMALSGLPESLYEIRVQTSAGRSTEYIMLQSFPDLGELELMGFLAPGAPRSNIALPEQAYHYWVFTAAAGNEITVTLTPGPQGDGFLTLFGPSGEDISETEEDDTGQTDVLNYTIELSGMYTILVEDLNGERMTYSILLEIQP